MCGYCMERELANALEAEEKGKEYVDDVLACLYLQETTDVLKGMKRYLSLADIKEYKKSDIVNAILCRMLGILIDKGFDSLEYQEFLKQQIIVDAIYYGCDKSTRDKVNGLGLPFLNSGTIGLYNAETFMNRSTWEDSIAKIADASSGAIQYYSNLLEEAHRVESEQGDKTKRQVFDLLFRVFYLSVCLAPKGDRTWQCLYYISTHGGVYSGFDGLDLWLRRRAFERIVKDKPGFTLIPYNPVIEPILYYFAVRKIGLTENGKRLLADDMEGIAKTMKCSFPVEIEEIINALRGPFK